MSRFKNIIGRSEKKYPRRKLTKRVEETKSNRTEVGKTIVERSRNNTRWEERLLFSTLLS